VLLLITGRYKEQGFTAGTPVRDWLVIALGYLGAHEFGLWALAYIPFPFQVVCKSCKAVPVMFGEKLFDAEKTHTRQKELSVLLMTVGVCAFTLLSGSKKKSPDMELTPTFFLGLTLVFAALICDGIYGPYQNKICNKYKPSQFHLMLNMNLYELLFAVLICILDGEFVHGIEFIQKYPEVLPNMLYFMTTMGLGNIFIFTMQANFGALTVTMTTTVRKLISVILSVLLFGHSIGPLQWLAVVCVFGSGEISKLLCKTLGIGKDDTKAKLK
jgi:UDP-galactose transporter B1